MITKPVGINTLRKSDNKIIYMVYGLDGMYYSNSSVTNWYQLDGNKHLNLIGFDELHLTSFMNESGNNNKLRVFESELVGIKKMDESQKFQIQNPVKEYIQLPENTTYYSLISTNGNTLLSGEISQVNRLVSISQMPIGLYLLGIKNKNSITTFHRIVISN